MAGRIDIVTERKKMTEKECEMKIKGKISKYVEKVDKNSPVKDKKSRIDLTTDEISKVEVYNVPIYKQ